MKRLVCGALAVIIALSLTAFAYAKTGAVEESQLNLASLQMDAAVARSGNLTFSASVDGSAQVPVEAKALDPELVGHIIVVDLAWAWTSTIDCALVVAPALKAYLSAINSDSQVKFILANAGGLIPTAYMSVSQAQLYIDNNIKLPDKTPGKPYATAIDAALKTAFDEAAAYAPGEPVFKSVFALADPANPGIGFSATKTRDEYKKSGSSFSVLIATVYPESYMEQNSKTETGQRVARGIEHYQTFAQNNDSVLAVLNYINRQPIVTASIPAMMKVRSYYSLDLANLHPLIDYTLEEHEIVLSVGDSRNIFLETLYAGIPSGALPAPLITPPPPEALVTPEPYIVKAGDNGGDAKLAINRLYLLYYLKLDKNELPGEFDVNCQYAFMEFCRVNGLPQQDNVSLAAYNLLMSDAAQPNPTPTPTAAPQTPEPTPEPTPLPRIYEGANSTYALRAIKMLKDLYYLDEQTKYVTWNNECMLAFLTLCQYNGIAYEQEYIDDPMYDWLINGNPRPWPTATPTVSVTPLPAPTVPPEGYALGQGDDDGGFIAKAQTVLHGLNLYRAEMVVGVMDQATLDAVALYCQSYGLSMRENTGVDKSILLDILTNGPTRAAVATPEPSLSQRFSEFLKRDALWLGSFAVKMWMLLVLAVVLVFALLLIIILANRKKADTTGFSVSTPPIIDRTPPPSGESAAGSGSGRFEEEATVPRRKTGGAPEPEDGDETVKVGSNINVTMTISGGVTSGARRVLIGGKNYVIGRPAVNGGGCDLELEGDKSVSRKHAALWYQNGSLYITNLSSNGTRVNGQALDDKGEAQSDETLPLNAPAKQSDSGAHALRRGDLIEIGGYRISVNW